MRIIIHGVSRIEILRKVGRSFAPPKRRFNDIRARCVMRDRDLELFVAGVILLVRETFKNNKIDDHVLGRINGGRDEVAVGRIDLPIVEVDREVAACENIRNSAAKDDGQHDK
ncbi:MAG: hypothetical protein ABII09_11270 [Planctomycetota bacterium]